MEKVRALPEGGTIGLVAPSSPAPKEKLEQAEALLEARGYRVKRGESCNRAWGYLAGPDDLRADDLHRFFADPEVDALFCVRGGDGATRLPGLLKADVFRANPKILLGYSDITVLHLFLHREAGFCTFHGPMATTEFVKETWSGYVEDALFRALTSTEPLGEIVPYEGAPAYETLVGGTAEGELAGGCLSLVTALMGTPWEIDLAGKIFVFEDVYEEPYKIDRMLCQLRMAGKLDAVAGIVVGQIVDGEPKDATKSLSLREVLESLLVPLGKPVLLNGPFGHDVKKTTLPLGARARLDAGAKSFWVDSGVR
ncbi:LD-carboxypeptidase [Aminithiophilus ramosus]|uniref:LD-carboxypeptidase n=2 Tax=Synergistales TaxID=649776 RepID=A0A9Q7ADR4_9BACT|nr:LD-carboxypeptidase [Aminithiophilus ramosus]QTX32489.1 LD-carboxypeptidase [Aminithiophilus ramosus]QVL36366.1 LD-carboxypeptidase [Synergistota bacterium]